MQRERPNTVPRAWRMAAVALGLLMAGGHAAAQDSEPINPIALTLRRDAPPEYKPGAVLEVMITISAAEVGSMTALGLYETVPPGWQFMQMRGMTDQPPPISPGQGESGVLSFAWINMPPLPASFAYTLATPSGEAGARFISGQLEYRLGGGRLLSPPVITEMAGRDTEPPVIQLLGDNPLILTEGAPYEEPGFTATDNADGDVSAQVQVSGVVDMNSPGRYTLTYTVSDQAGNNAIPKRRVVQVVAQSNTGNTADTTSPGNNSRRPAGRSSRGNPAAGTSASLSRPITPERASDTAANKPPEAPDSDRARDPARQETDAAAYGAPSRSMSPIANVVRRLTQNVADPGTGEGTEPPTDKRPGSQVGPQSEAEASAPPGRPTPSAALQPGSPTPDRAPNAPSGATMIDNAMTALSRLSKSQLTALTVTLGVGGGILGLAALAWKIAYGGSPRRNKNNP